MAKTKNSLFPLLAIGALGLYWISQRKEKSLSNMSYSFGLPSAMSISKGNVIATLPLYFDNASPDSTTAQDLYLDMYKDGKVVGNIKFAGKIVFPARSRTTVKTGMVIYGERIGLNLAESLISKANSIPGIQVKGTVKAEGFNVFIDKTIDIPLNLNVVNSITDSFRRIL
jgi:hypothetical protein